MADRYLLLINLGPVQGFIATARRTRDLYAGSRLLSEAAQRVAEELIKETPNGPAVRLIFPSATRPDELEDLAESGIPNVILAEVEGLPPEAIRNLAENAENAARDLLKEKIKKILDKDALARVLNTARADLDTLKKAAEDQAHDLLEFYYVAVPIQESYPKARDRAGRWMAARKNTRNFKPNPWPAPVFKSSLDGALESLTAERNHRLEQKLKLGIREGEHLSGVDLLKRFYHLTHANVRFASTSDMALLPFLAGLDAGQEKALKKTLARIQSRLSQGQEGFQTRPPRAIAEAFPLLQSYDARLFFPERHRELFVERPAQGQTPPWEETSQALQKRYQELQKEPFPYYAILHADGDRMGKAIDAQKDPDNHRKLSAKLTEFAKGVRKTVEDHHGSLVYSGGDDVLALLPLHTALDCARQLAKDFQETLSSFSTEDGLSPTLSVGVAVVHHLYDLGEALELARQAEKEAKKTRNALAITYAPRSGVSTTARGQWSEPEPLPARIQKLADYLNNDQIPQGFAYELKQLAEVLEGLENPTLKDLEDPDLKEEILKAEAERILNRKELLGSKAQKDLLNWIQSLGPEELAREILIARPFAKAFRLAEKPAKEAP